MYLTFLFSLPQESSGNVLATGLTGSNLAEVDELLRAVKIHSTAPFGREVKLGVPCHTFMACKRIFHS
jgi:hypothetical protein